MILKVQDIIKRLNKEGKVTNYSIKMKTNTVLLYLTKLH